MSKKRIGLTHQRAVTGYLFILPFIIGFILFMIQPLYQSLQMSLSDVALNSGKHGFGLTWNNYYNYIKAFTIDPEFNRMLATQIETMIVQSIATIVFSFFVALILNQQFKGRALVRSIFFLAVILSSGVLVGIEYNNSLLAGLKKTIEEEGNANSVTSVLEKILTSGTINASSKKIFDTLFEIIDKIYDVAMASGIQIIIFLSGLQNISPSMYEAAEMEGCTKWESLWKITVPMISPIFLVCWVYTIIDFFTKTNNQIMEKINNVMIVQLNYGYSSALAWIYFVVVMLLIALSSWIIKKVVSNYE